MNNEDFLDALTAASFILGLANYNENLTQNDKAEMMQGLDKQTAILLERLEEDLEKQNEMLKEQTMLLREILRRRNG